jgi:hypothetical protein
VLAAAEELIAALGAFRPLNGVPGADEKTPWTAGAPHAGMAEVAEALSAQAMLLKGEARYDLAAAQALAERQPQTEDAAQDAGGAGAQDGDEPAPEATGSASTADDPAPGRDAPAESGATESAPPDVQAAE